MIDNSNINLWEMVCVPNNIRLAANEYFGFVEPEAHLHKLPRAKAEWIRNREANEARLRELLLSNSYRFGAFASKVVTEPKRREINYHRNFEDNIVELAVLRVVHPYYQAQLSDNVYGSVKGRGLIAGQKHLFALVKAHPDAYYVQTDCRKYYESISHDLLLRQVDATVPDANCRDFIRSLIATWDKGIPLGLPFNQHNGNLMLSPIDQWLDAHPRVISYVRNMDDIIVIVPDKRSAQSILAGLIERTAALGLDIKPNHRIAPVACGIDALGYVVYPTHVRIRRRIKDNFRRKVARLRRLNLSDKQFKQAVASHYGWCQHANARHLLQRILGDKLHLFDKMQIKRKQELKPKRLFFGLEKSRYVSMADLIGVEILILEVAELEIKGEEKVAVKFCLTAELSEEPTDAELAEAARYTITRSAVIRDRLAQDADIIPFAATVLKINNKYFCYE